MSLGYPPLRPRPTGSQDVEGREGQGENYGLPQPMLHGFQSVKHQLTSHPLEYTEEHWNENRQKMDMAMLRNLQGIHAPLRIAMERNTAKKVQRLPFLPSSNLMHETLTGKIDMIEYDDILNDPACSEVVGQPHVLTEKKLAIL